MTRSLALSFALLASGCCLGGGGAPDPAPEPIPDWMRAPEGVRISPPEDDLFVYASVSRVDGASAPARFHAAIPSTLATAPSFGFCALANMPSMALVALSPIKPRA